jgi:hypothetical protein
MAESVLGDLLDRFVQDAELELEACVRIQNGMTFDQFKKLLDAFKTQCGSILKEEAYSRYIDVYAKDIRTRCIVGRTPVTIQKTRVAHADFLVSGRTGVSIRVNLKREKVQETSVCVRVPTHVRVCERWKFNYREMYMYDFTKVCTGSSTVSACETPACFEVEIEVLRPISEDRSKFVKSYISKILDLCGKNRTTDTGTVRDDLSLLLFSHTQEHST